MPNIAFTRVIKVNGRLREFNFRKLPGDELKFHIDVTDEKGQRIQFIFLRNDHDQWKVKGENVPNWIFDTTQVLQNEIKNSV